MQDSIVWTPSPPPPPPPLTSLEEGNPKNFKKGVGNYGAGAGLLKKGSFLLLEITLGKILLCIRRKIIFFYHHNFLKKRHLKLYKN